MSNGSSPFDASQSALGYLHQCQYALLLGLLRDEEPNLSISIEKLDDTEPISDRSLEELADDDRAAVRRLFEFIFEVTDTLSPKLQVIITDHADLNEEWFQVAVKERWRGGIKLVPASWYEEVDHLYEPDEPDAVTGNDTNSIEE